MTVMAVMGFGPRASAAYVSMADTTSPGGVCCASSDSPATPVRALNQDQNRDGSPQAAHLSGGGGMAPSGSGSSFSSPSVLGHLTSVELPASGLVVYFREPAASFDLSKFIDSILDPPRQA
jgi:hypothetical protein